jgi:hypothetical protein
MMAHPTLEELEADIRRKAGLADLPDIEEILADAGTGVSRWAYLAGVERGLDDALTCKVLADRFASRYGRWTLRPARLLLQLVVFGVSSEWLNEHLRERATLRQQPHPELLILLDEDRPVYLRCPSCEQLKHQDEWDWWTEPGSYQGDAVQVRTNAHSCKNC